MKNNDTRDIDNDGIIENISSVDIEEIRAKAIEETKKEKHQWKQKGNVLICEKCKVRHGLYLPPDKIMIGQDGNGMPILKNKHFFSSKK